ncbi:hypothetical protein [Methylomonas sp. 11b]|uniref:hypothetical protein n=1 Tax=Methylomonas sp. 11b TaxID=1168169 RepID=UPI00047B5498|nr:hypothetical protein [Methylomonas sp. 11b]
MSELKRHPDCGAGCDICQDDWPCALLGRERVQSRQRDNSILKYFAFEHLPDHLQVVSKPIGELALAMDQSLPDGPEKSAGLRKLLEAKDCFVRAKVG